MAPRKGQRIIPDAERKGHTVAVRITDAEFIALERIAKRKDLPISRFVREGIAYIIKRYK